MIVAYELNLIEGHIIVVENRTRILVDTGSPVSISNTGSISFMGRDHDVATEMPMIGNITSLSEMAGVQFDALMGMDIMSEYIVEIDFFHNLVIFGNEDIPFEGSTTIPLNTLMNCPFIKMDVEGTERTMIVDTGAKISYIMSSITHGRVAEDNLDDFSPLYGGHFTTPIFTMEAAIAGKKFAAKFGNLPQQFETLIGCIADGVIGYDLFDSNIVMLDFPNNKMLVK